MSDIMKNYFTMIDEKYLKRFEQIIFDLDDTLIYEQDYLFAAYLEIGKKFSKNKFQRLSMYNFLVENFKIGNRSRLFNDFIHTFSLEESDLSLILTILRTVKIEKGLSITEESKIILNLLLNLRRDYYIITNGNPIQQQNKFTQINWERFPKPSKIVFANEYRPKPSPDSFLKTRDLIPANKVLYIGDSDVDYEFARNCEIEFYKSNLKCE